MKKEFEEFLRKHKAIRAFKKMWNATGHEETYEEYFKTTEPYAYLGSAFIWDMWDMFKTGKKNSMYWEKLNNKWEIFLNENKYEDWVEENNHRLS